MFKILKELFGFPNYYSGKLRPRRPWPKEMTKSTGVGNPNNPTPPCPPVVESENFKKVKEIIALDVFKYKACYSLSYLYELGDITVYFWPLSVIANKPKLAINYKGIAIPLTEEEENSLGAIWKAKEDAKIKIARENATSEFLKLDINELIPN